MSIEFKTNLTETPLRVKVAKVVCAFLLFGMIAQCFNGESGKQTKSKATGIGEFSALQICKAGIATVMGRDPLIMSAHQNSPDSFAVNYTRGDRKFFSYKCKINGTSIVWGNSDGRWRDDPRDPYLTFRVSGDRIFVIENHGGGESGLVKKDYTLAEIGI